MAKNDNIHTYKCLKCDLKVTCEGYLPPKAKCIQCGAEMEYVQASINPKKLNSSLKTDEDIKTKILEAAKRKKVVEFMQYDVHLNLTGNDDICHPDKDGDCLMWDLDKDLRNFTGVRLTFKSDTNPFQVLKALDKIEKQIKYSMSSDYKRRSVDELRPGYKPEGIADEIPF